MRRVLEVALRVLLRIGTAAKVVGQLVWDYLRRHRLGPAVAILGALIAVAGVMIVGPLSIAGPEHARDAIGRELLHLLGAMGLVPLFARLTLTAARARAKRHPGWIPVPWGWWWLAPVAMILLMSITQEYIVPLDLAGQTAGTWGGDWRYWSDQDGPARLLRYKSIADNMIWVFGALVSRWSSYYMADQDAAAGRGYREWRPRSSRRPVTRPWTHSPAAQTAGKERKPTIPATMQCECVPISGPAISRRPSPARGSVARSAGPGSAAASTGG